MTHISPEALVQLASLSAIELSSEESALFTDDIERILTYIDQLTELDTDTIEPTYQVTGLSNVWREDVPQDEPQSEVRNELLSLAGKNVTENQIKVPKVL